jgi:peptide/nickel transport system ATP-binding protein
MVFQSPDTTLNPRHRVRRIVGRAVAQLGRLGRRAAKARARDLLAAVRLPESAVDAPPLQLSGGQRQRVAIARAFAGDPDLVILDEPTSALDVSVQAAVLDLLLDLQAQRGVAYLFISHDLAVVRYLADRIAVLYRGELVEVGPAAAVLGEPRHPYTRALLAAMPEAEGSGDIPAWEPAPGWREAGPGHAVRCWREGGLER